MLMPKEEEVNGSQAQGKVAVLVISDKRLRLIYKLEEATGVSPS
jgi:hypothetical protein